MSDAQPEPQVPSVYQRLSERFPAGAHKTRKQGGRDLLYVSGEMVIGRLNEVLGFDGWSFEVKKVTVLEDEVWAEGRLTIYTGERTVIREQTGGQIINRTRGIPATPARPAQAADGDRPAIPAVEARPAVKGEIIEIANDIKGAVTDCLKKCATLVGVGTYLYDEDDRREVEAERRSGSRPAPQAPTALNAVRTAAALTGAETTIRCRECGDDVPKDGTVTILRKKEGPRVEVKVSDFEPVCKERLGEFHCARCYERKYWGAA